MVTHEQRWQRMGLVLPAAPKPLGNYAPVVVSKGLVFLSGMVPVKDGAPHFVGRVGDMLSVEQGQEAVRMATLNALAALRERLGNFDLIARVVKLTVHVLATDDFTQHALVANAASQLLGDVFGPDGVHARAALGAASLPGGMCCELELIFELVKVD